MNWLQFNSYRVFGEFLKCVVLKRRSFVTKAHQKLDLPAVFADIKTHFADHFDASVQHPAKVVF